MVTLSPGCLTTITTRAPRPNPNPTHDDTERLRRLLTIARVTDGEGLNGIIHSEVIYSLYDEFTQALIRGYVLQNAEMGLSSRMQVRPSRTNLYCRKAHIRFVMPLEKFSATWGS